jgi:hypothetical protein
MSRSFQRRTYWLLLGALAILLVVIGAWGWRVGRLAFSLRDRATRLQTMVAEPRQVKLSTLAEQVHGARQELTELRGELWPLLWLGERLGGDLAAGRSLMDAAFEAVSAGDEALAALAPALSDISLASFSMSTLPRVLDALVTARPALQSAAVHLDAANSAMARIQRPLSPRVERLVERADTLVTLAQQGIGGTLVAPELLGRDSPRTYLVLVQNSDELRPTGGFISTVGRLVISHGAVVTQTFQDSYTVDDFTKPYPDPPWQLLEYMGLDLWVMRDANWSPDFPTSARDVISLYQISRPEPIYGVIGINQKLVQTLIPALEPLTVEGMPEPLTAANAEEMFREAWGPAKGDNTTAWIYSRKMFVGATVRAMMDRLTSGGVNWTRLGQGMFDALRQRQVMIYSTGPEAAELAHVRWDGAVRSDRGDFLMLADANVGYGKVNPLIDQRVDYSVTLQPDGSGHATVTVDYRHLGTQSGVICNPAVAYDANVTYDKMMQRCYFDYLRLMMPQGSRLVSSTERTVPGAYLLSGKSADGKATLQPDEAGRSVIGQFFAVEYGQSLQTRIEYDLPVVVVSTAGHQRYLLTLQKQSGTGDLPFRVRLMLPSGARPIETVPRPTAQSGVALEFNLKLDTDQQILVDYVLAR